MGIVTPIAILAPVESPAEVLRGSLDADVGVVLSSACEVTEAPELLEVDVLEVLVFVEMTKPEMVGSDTAASTVQTPELVDGQAAELKEGV